MAHLCSMYQVGQKIHALVDGEEAVIYLSLTTEGKNDRRDHCWRYAPPSNMDVPKDATVKPGKPVGRESEVKAEQFRKQ